MRLSLPDPFSGCSWGGGRIAAGRLSPGHPANATYEAIEIQLEPGDQVVFCSDGIVEAGNTAGEIFGFERTAETIHKGYQGDLSAEALLERIIQEVKGFTGDEPQGDDQTIVVLHVEA